MVFLLLIFLFTEISEKVAFSAIFTQRLTSHNGQTLVFSHILTNIGGGYSNQDGVFTAPVDGSYVFFCKITHDSNRNDMIYQFILNGSVKTQTLAYGRSDHAYRTTSNLIVMQLIRGDRVWIKMFRGGDHYYYGAGGDQSFSGFLL